MSVAILQYSFKFWPGLPGVGRIPGRATKHGLQEYIPGGFPILFLLYFVEQGYDDNDRDQVEEGLSSVAVKELDLDFAKLAR